MTYEEVKKICDSMWQADLLNADIQKVREALEMQIPKRPQEYTLYTESDEEVHYEGCPNCKAILNKSHYFLKVCRCGQKLEV